MNNSLKQVAVASMLACLGSAAFAANYFYIQPKSQEMSKVAPYAISLDAASLPDGQIGQAYLGTGYDFSPLAVIAGDPNLNPSLVQLSLASGTLPAGMLFSGGRLSGTPSAATTGIDLVVTANYKTASGSRTYRFVVGSSPQGQIAYTTPGTFSFTAPAGVTAVSVVAIGGGAGGSNGMSSGWSWGGGGGGGLGWKNNITVIPGQTYTVVVGAGGLGAIGDVRYGAAGGSSYFYSQSTVSGYGASLSAGGGFTGTGGGLGATVPNHTTGGGGAGGYSGNGGTNTGGAAGSGAFNSTNNVCSGGGGVGIYGQGTSGSPLVANSSAGGNPGSGGSTGGISGPSYLAGNGATFGGGGGCTINVIAGHGAGGAVRVIWGAGRAFPATLTGDI